MEFGPQQVGKWLVFAGIIIALLGGLIMILGRIGLFKLPWYLVTRTGGFIYPLEPA